MSLILEALKKSEANRRLGEAPDLATPFATRRQRRSSLPLLLVLIVATAAGGWWLLRAPATGDAPAAVSEGNPAVASKPGSAVHATAAASASAPGEHNIAADKPWIKRGNGMGTPMPATPMQAAPAAPHPAPPPQPVAVAPPKPAPSTAMSQPVNPPTPAVRTENRAPPAPAPAVPKAAEPSAPSTAAAPPVKASAPAVTTANRTPAPTAEPPPAAPSYAELPFSVRKDLPTLKLSMHVYAADPAARFVMLNNAQLHEGDKQDDLTVHEIRPDGVILEFRGQRFFYPRDGM